MGLFTNTGYLFGEGLRGLFRNRLVNFAAVGMLTACLVITGAFALTLVNVNAAIEKVGAANEISVFIEDSCSEERQQQIGAEIIELPNVAGARFVSAAEGLESLREEFGELLDGLEDDNPLRASYIITLRDQSKLGETAAALGSVQGIAKVNFRSDIAAKFLQIRNVIAMVGLTFVVVLGLIAVFIISNSIRISAYTRRNELAIMKTVGATNRFIRTSFVIEGMLIGLLGGGISLALIWPAYEKLLVPAVNSLNFITAVPFEQFAPVIILAYAGAGLLLGSFGSSIAIRKYLKV